MEESKVRSDAVWSKHNSCFLGPKRSSSDRVQETGTTINAASYCQQGRHLNFVIIKWRLRLWDIEKPLWSHRKWQWSVSKTLSDELDHDIRPPPPTRRQPKHWSVRLPLERKGAFGRKNDGGRWKVEKRECFCRPYCRRTGGMGRDETPPNQLGCFCGKWNTLLAV